MLYKADANPISYAESPLKAISYLMIDLSLSSIFAANAAFFYAKTFLYSETYNLLWTMVSLLTTIKFLSVLIATFNLTIFAFNAAI